MKTIIQRVYRAKTQRRKVLKPVFWRLGGLAGYNIIPGILFILIVVGCEDMMTKKLDIDSADFPPKLAVSATLDTDSGRFTMTLYEGQSLTSYNRNPGSSISRQKRDC